MRTEETAILGVVYFLFESIDEIFIKAAYLCHGIEDKRIARVNAGVSLNRMKTGSKRYIHFLKKTFQTNATVLFSQSC
jgi:hypothetical protein